MIGIELLLNKTGKKLLNNGSLYVGNIADYVIDSVRYIEIYFKHDFKYYGQIDSIPEHLKKFRVYSYWNNTNDTIHINSTDYNRKKTRTKKQ